MIKKKSVVSVVLLTALLGTTVLSGCGSDNKAEEDTQSSTESIVSTAAPEESKDAETEKPSAPAEPSEVDPLVKLAEEDNGPIPEIEDPTPDNMGEDVNNIFVYNNVAYEYFFGDESMAQHYADVISSFKNMIGPGITLYNVVVPTHVGVDLPAKFDGEKSTSQKDYLNKIVTSYSANVRGVDAYNKIVHHRNEYLYFNSDHHWTALGAYYAYRSFAQVAGFEPLELSSLKTGKIEDVYGSFSSAYDVPDLKADTVTYYYPSYKIDCKRYDENGQNPMDWSIINKDADSDTAMYAFLGGDQPLMVTKNPKGNGKKIAVLKESYGNAFSPFICYTYSETHLIDLRSLKIDIKEYLDKNNITDVIIINNAMATASSVIVDAISDFVNRNALGADYVNNANDDENDEDENEESYEEDEGDSDDNADEDNGDDTGDDTGDNTGDEGDDNNNDEGYGDDNNNDEGYGDEYYE